MLEEKAAYSYCIWFKEYNQSLITTGKTYILTSKGADNVEKALESMKERLKITRMQDALTKRQCYTCFGY
jgi:chemotaxis protein MotB